MKLSLLKVVFALGLVSSTALAWNNAGHGTIGVIAYEQLSPAARTAAVELLQSHPHFKRYLLAGLDGTPDLKSEAVQRHIFKQVATWADWVRPGATQTDKSVSDFHHSNWHYINFPYVRAQDKAAFPAMDSRTAIGDGLILEKLAECARVIPDKSKPASERAVMLAWYFHMVGDLHQPLHAAALVTPELPTGDRGGNDETVQLEPSDKKNPEAKKKAEARPLWILHSYWDGILGEAFDDESVGKAAAAIRAEFGGPTKLAELQNGLTPTAWAAESFALAVKFVYLDGTLKYGPPLPKREEPALDPAKVPELPDGYRKNGSEIARRRAATAGYRLAAGIEKMVK